MNNNLPDNTYDEITKVSDKADRVAFRAINKALDNIIQYIKNDNIKNDNIKNDNIKNDNITDNNADNVVKYRVKYVLDNIVEYAEKLRANILNSNEFDVLDHVPDVKTCIAAKDASYGGKTNRKHRRGKKTRRNHRKTARRNR